jgi:uncharacterized protein (TIGR00661 family)
VATIFYGLSGEGLGHATRARTVVEALRDRHRITLFAPDRAYALLAPLYQGTEVAVVPIPGLRFGYSRPGKVGLFRTLAVAARYAWGLGPAVRALHPHFARERPDLVIADFEPLLPRAARERGVPFVSFDHQHYLVVSDLSRLPFWLRQQAALIAPFVRALYDWQQATVVSSFYKPPLKRRHRDATQVGVLIRPELQALRPQHDRHLVVYLRRFGSPELLSTLAGSGRQVEVYGLGARPPERSLRFHAIDNRRFLEHLATCDAVVSTAGNQLVGEALYLRKPLLVMPEQRNFEQNLNGFFLEDAGTGWCLRGRLTAGLLGAFLEQTETLRARIDPQAVCGNAAALAALEAQLAPAAPTVSRPERELPDAARRGGLHPTAADRGRAQWA